MKYTLILLIACATPCPRCVNQCPPKSEVILVPNKKVPEQVRDLFEKVKVKKK